MNTTRLCASLVCAGVVGATALCGDRANAQGADPNAAPNPYRLEENWAQLPAGRKWGMEGHVENCAPLAGGASERVRAAGRW